MKLVSLISSINISDKDVILYKRTNKTITSETYFNIPPQPKNTCPIIDNSLEDFENGVLVKILGIMDEAIVLLKEKPIEDDQLSCDCFEKFKDNYREFEHFVFGIRDFKKDFKKLTSKMEELRKGCELLRAYGEDLKYILWTSDNPKSEWKKLETSRPELKISVKDVEQTFDNLIKGINPPKNKNIECKDWCRNCEKDADLGTFIMTECRLNFSFSDRVEKAFDNYKRIEEWIKNLESLLESKIDNKLKIEFSKAQLKEYVELWNQDHKERNFEIKFKNEFKNEIAALIPLSIEDRIMDFIKDTENLTSAKKFKEFETRTNDLILEFKKLNLDQDYKDLCQIFYEFFKKVSEFKEELDSYEDKDNKGQPIVFLSSPIYPIRNPINEMFRLIQSYGPQLFKLEI